MAGGAAVAAAGAPAFAAEPSTLDLAVASGDDPKELAKRAVAELGGMKRFVSKGDVVVVKPNICWVRAPETAANTNPDVVAGIVEMVFDAGAREVRIFDITDRDPVKCYESSGVTEAAERLGAKIYYQDDLDATKVQIKEGRFLKESLITNLSLECDCFINVPVAKHHNSSILSMAMKNLMGIVKEDQWKVWHPNLAQAIADFNTEFRPTLAVLDAYRILFRRGPAGGNLQDVKLVKQCIVGTNPASVDAYGATLFDRKPEAIPHIAIANEMGIGEIDLSKLRIRRV
jgi:uncharacterized protein (DUF362 family)